jgi:hypothetical protein
MNAQTSDRNSLTCPFCQHSGKLQPGQMACGLYTCPNCQAHFVISWSGHYVRDPLSLHQPAAGHVLRRQSSPIARIIRDFGIARVAILASAAIVGLTWLVVEYQHFSNTSPRPQVENVRKES